MKLNKAMKLLIVCLICGGLVTVVVLVVEKLNQ